jgi:protein-tyrosine phosphatase
MLLFNGCSLNPSALNPENTLNEKLFATRQLNGSYLLNLPLLGEWKVYQGTSPDHIKWENPLVTKEEQVYFPAAPDRGRIFFAVDNGKGDTVIVSERQIPTDEQPNFRDLGGLPTRDGTFIKWGTLYRSGHLGNLDKNDLRYFSKLGIKTVVDLRNDIEVAKDPDRYPSGVKYVQHSLSDKEGKAYSRLKQMVMREGYRRAKAKQLFVDVMKSFADTLATDVKPVFDLMLSDKADAPLLYHCTGGKDRTGYMTAMILLALGVERKTITEDYLMSNYYRRDLNIRNMKRARLIGLDAETLEYAMLVRKEYMDAVFEVIDTKYGGNASYLEAKFGLTEEKRNELKRRYTSPYFSKQAQENAANAQNAEAKK